MDYKEMSNEKLYELLIQRFGLHCVEVADDNRETVIAVLKFLDQQGD